MSHHPFHTAALCALFALLLGGCGDKSDDSGSSATVTECAKVLCAADEYCLSVTGGIEDSGAEDDVPECIAAPEECGGVPSCDCLDACSECSDDDGVYCSIDAP
jgi:hypothetical protein